MWSWWSWRSPCCNYMMTMMTMMVSSAIHTTAAIVLYDRTLSSFSLGGVCVYRGGRISAWRGWLPVADDMRLNGERRDWKVCVFCLVGFSNRTVCAVFGRLKCCPGGTRLSRLDRSSVVVGRRARDFFSCSPPTAQTRPSVAPASHPCVFLSNTTRRIERNKINNTCT